MVGSRTVTAVVGVAASLAISALLWYYTNSLVVFLVVPFVPLLLRGLGDGEADHGRTPAPAKRCPACGFETRNPGYAHCPRDGTRLRADERAR